MAGNADLHHVLELADLSVLLSDQLVHGLHQLKRLRRRQGLVQTLKMGPKNIYENAMKFFNVLNQGVNVMILADRFLLDAGSRRKVVGLKSIF
jgi:hypothetical protein